LWPALCACFACVFGLILYYTFSLSSVISSFFSVVGEKRTAHCGTRKHQNQKKKLQPAFYYFRVGHYLCVGIVSTRWSEPPLIFSLFCVFFYLFGLFCRSCRTSCVLLFCFGWISNAQKERQSPINFLNSAFPFRLLYLPVMWFPPLWARLSGVWGFRVYVLPLTAFHSVVVVVRGLFTWKNLWPVCTLTTIFYFLFVFFIAVSVHPIPVLSLDRLRLNKHPLRRFITILSCSLHSSSDVPYFLYAAPLFCCVGFSLSLRSCSLRAWCCFLNHCTVPAAVCCLVW